MKTGDTTPFLTVKEVADRLRVSKMTVYRLIQDGSLPAVRLGRSFRISRYEAFEYIKDSQYVPPQT